MQILMDTREQDALTFQMLPGVTVKSECLPTGDYWARHKDGTMDTMIFERKSIGDLWGSFSDEDRYKREKEKMVRAKDLKLTYCLAIEGTIFDVRKGFSYMKNGEEIKSKKDGLTQLRQLCTIERKYGIRVMYFPSRTEMAFAIQEHFLSYERFKNNKETLVIGTPEEIREGLELAKISQPILTTDRLGTYMFHFSKPIQYKNAHDYGDSEHYIGFSLNVENRVKTHLSGKGSVMTQAALAQGASLHLSYVFPDVNCEKALTYSNFRKFCCYCNPRFYEISLKETKYLKEMKSGFKKEDTSCLN